MIAFRPLARANPSRPSPHQAAQIPRLRPPKATPSGGTENSPDPQPTQRQSITSSQIGRVAAGSRSEAEQPHGDGCCSPCYPRQNPDGCCSRRYTHQIPAPLLAAQFRSAASRSIHPLPDDGRAARISKQQPGFSGVANGRARGSDKRRGSRSSPAPASSSVGGDRWGRQTVLWLPAPDCPWELASITASAIAPLIVAVDRGLAFP